MIIDTSFEDDGRPIEAVDTDELRELHMVLDADIARLTQHLLLIEAEIQRREPRPPDLPFDKEGDE